VGGRLRGPRRRASGRRQRAVSPDFLTQNFRHDLRRPELVLATDNPGRSRPVAISGWSLLTQGAQRNLSAAIRRYTAELDRHNAEPQPIVAGLVALADRLESAPPLLSATLNGLDDAFVMRRRSPQLPVRDPLAPSQSAAAMFAKRVAAAAGPPPGSAPEPAWELEPLRTGFLRLEQLRVVGNFGIARPLAFGSVHLPSTFSPVLGTEHAVLPPRIFQPSRVRFRWLDASAGGGDQESTDHPSTAPVHGWFVIDYLDARILAFDAEGGRLGTLEVDGAGVIWVPGSTSFTSDVMVAIVERLRTLSIPAKATVCSG
jgi:hypothetical protein